MEESRKNIEFNKRASSSQFLDNRININRKYSLVDMEKWLMKRISSVDGEKILDVGCGTGLQTIPLSKNIGTSGRIVAIDISRESINKLNDIAKNENLNNIETIVGDMDELDTILSDQYPQSYFDMINSSYSLYYSNDPARLLKIMYSYLNPNGRMILFVPNKPHGLIEFVKKYSAIPKGIEDSLEFGPKVLEPFYQENFKDISIHLYSNVMNMKQLDDFKKFYRSTTYYDKSVENPLYSDVQKVIEMKGSFSYEKNGYLIIGNQKKDVNK